LWQRFSIWPAIGHRNTPWLKREPLNCKTTSAALGLIGIDVTYVARQVIPPIYLADAAAEVLLLAC
jgi:hypothetical protein